MLQKTGMKSSKHLFQYPDGRDHMKDLDAYGMVIVLK
jgi:hypothetical protein